MSDEELVLAYRGGLSTYQLASIAGITSRTVLRRLVRAGCERRPSYSGYVPPRREEGWPVPAGETAFLAALAANDPHGHRFDLRDRRRA